MTTAIDVKTLGNDELIKELLENDCFEVRRERNRRTIPSCFEAGSAVIKLLSSVGEYPRRSIYGSGYRSVMIPPSLFGKLRYIPGTPSACGELVLNNETEEGYVI
jgi:hypothetical protein